MPKFAILRTAKISSLAHVGRLATHHARAKPVPNADPARGVEMLAGSPDPAEVRELVGAVVNPLKRRKDAVIAVDVFLGMSPDASVDPGAFGRAAQAFLCRTFGPDNVALSALHLDETTPHVQALVLPVTPDGRLAASHWLGSPAKLRALQDAWARECAPLGLVRGVQGSKARHEDLAAFRARNADREAKAQRALEEAEALRAEAAKAVARTSEQERSFQARAQRVLAQLRERQGEIDARQTEIVGMAKDLEAERKHLKAEAARLQRLAAALTPEQEQQAAQRYAKAAPTPPPRPEGAGSTSPAVGPRGSGGKKPSP